MKSLSNYRRALIQMTNCRALVEPSEAKTRRVVVTGLGIVSPVGVGKESNWTKLLKGYCGVVKVKGNGYDGIPCQIAAYVPEDQLDLEAEFTKYEIRNLSLSTLYALLAADEAIKDSKWHAKTELDQISAGVLIGVGMVDIQYIISSGALFNTKGYSKLSPHFVTRILSNMPAGHISLRHKLKGPNSCVSTACASGAHSIGDAYNLIKKGSANMMVCGGTEATINPISIAAFARIRALCIDFNNEPNNASRPFDKQRCGFVMGEGAGIIILEELENALRRNADIYAEVLGYGMSGDAHHITAPRDDGEGAYLCMKSAIDDAKIDLKSVGYVNAHATSTPIGDEAELNALKRLFGPDLNKIAISSTKGSTGHLLGAAGAIEAIYTILSVFHGIIPPTINLNNPIDESLTFAANKYLEWTSKRRIALKNAFGFGGTNASLVISNFHKP